MVSSSAISSFILSGGEELALMIDLPLSYCCVCMIKASSSFLACNLYQFHVGKDLITPRVLCGINFDQLSVIEFRSIRIGES